MQKSGKRRHGPPVWWRWVLALSALLISRGAQAGGGTVPLEGIVLEKGDREPVSGVHVKLESAAAGGPFGTVTDERGRFHFTALPPGEVQVSLGGGRILPAQSKELLRAGRRTTVTYYVTVKRNPFQAVVRASGVRKEVVEQVLSVDEVRHLAGTTNDTVKAVSDLPGVARSAFGSGLLIVWGSAPNDTRVYADGVSIPRVYHYGGLRSVINAEFVSQVAFFPGAYGADYGRGLGGLVEINTREPRSDKLHGSVTLDLIDGSVTLEGPLSKCLHIALGARVSWISSFLPLFGVANGILPFYYDYQMALHYRASSRDNLDVLVFGATDTTSVRLSGSETAGLPDVSTKQYFSRALLRWTHRFSPDTVLTVTPSVGGDNFTVDTGIQQTIPLRVFVNTYSYNLRAELRHRFHELLDSAIGLDFEGQYNAADVLAPYGQPGTSVQTGTFPSSNLAQDLGGPGEAYLGEGVFSDGVPEVIHEISAVQLIQAAPYLITRIELLNRRLSISPQLRVEIDAFNSGEGVPTHSFMKLAPRLLVRGEVVKDRLWLKAALGAYHQPPEPAYLTVRFGNPNLGLQQATTYVAGLDLNPLATLHIEAEAFYKDLAQLVVPDLQTQYSNAGSGRVYGGEILVRQRPWHNLFGWVSYTLSRSERRDGPGEPWHLFRYDQTHILTLVLGYRLPWGLEAGLRFRYVTGSPITPIVGAVRNASDQGYEPVVGAPYSGRLPAFNQLDLRIDKTFVFNRWKLGLFLDIQNLYNAQNSEDLLYGGRQLYQSGRLVGLPFFPDLGVRADF